MQIPETGLTKDDVFTLLEAARAGDWPWREGKLFAYVFDGGRDLEEVGKRAYMAYLSENGLDPTTFPSLLRFENDLVDMARRHLGGDERVVGNFTSGGTESILLAVKTARDWFRARKGSAEVPEMVVPITAHAAFHKAAHYFGVKLVPTPVHPETFRADPAAVAAAVNERTLMVVASASSYAHGVVDPVAEIAEIARARGILCHVDGCMGGFLLPYFRRLGAKVPDFDFRVPGVTSISVDLHKYALCPKGASIILYRDADLRAHQIFACAEWTGYTMINNTIQSTKSGGPMAAAWAVLQFVGDDGYERYAKDLLEARDALVSGIRSIAGLRMMGEPEMSLVAFTANDLSVFALADELKVRGFHVQPELAYGPSRENIHLSIMPANTRWIAPFVDALRESVAAVRAAGGGPERPTAIASAIAAQVEADTTGEAVRAIVSALASDGGRPPGKMADINALLNELPRPVQAKLLVAFVNQMFTPRDAGNPA
jgi:glutamate/tyrosine decarboxylase-like PLP-dependent enzyme